MKEMGKEIGDGREQEEVLRKSRYLSYPPSEARHVFINWA
jgi:hypothetical protein